jgi:isopentenyl-diphosphate delta-isomerase
MMPFAGSASTDCWGRPESGALVCRAAIIAARGLSELKFWSVIVDFDPSEVRDTVSDLDALILVDAADRAIGRLGKTQCHEGSGILHRAFSLLVFNAAGELLIQQRAASKRLWPLYWSNSCCSHPRAGETMDAAIQRRLREELGISCPLQFLFKFRYRAQFDATGSEHELCSVFIGRCAEPVSVDPGEISAWRWIGPDDLAAELSAHGEKTFTPWFMLEWARIWREHREAVLSLGAQN